MPQAITQALLEHHRVFIPSDPPFRARCRLLQALWREDHHLPIGSYLSPDGNRYHLGSLIAQEAGQAGANFLTPSIAESVQKRGLLTGRLASNLLSSQPLVCNLLEPLARSSPQAASFINELCPVHANVNQFLFEHKPTTTAATYDAFIEYTNFDDQPGFIAIEVKYSENANPTAQLKRQYQASQTLIDSGHYTEGVLLFIAPEQNHHILNPALAFTRDLDHSAVPLIIATLEDASAAIGLCDEDHATLLHDRYLNLDRW